MIFELESNCNTCMEVGRLALPLWNSSLWGITDTSLKYCASSGSVYNHEVEIIIIFN